MLPSRFARTAPAGRANIPLWLVAVGAVVLLLAAVTGWVLIGMGSAPEQTPVQTEQPVKL